MFSLWGVAGIVDIRRTRAFATGRKPQAAATVNMLRREIDCMANSVGITRELPIVYLQDLQWVQPASPLCLTWPLLLADLFVSYREFNVAG